MTAIYRTLRMVRQRLAYLRRRDDREDEQLLGRFLVSIVATALYTLVPAPSSVGLLIGTICTGLGLVSLGMLALAIRAPIDKPCRRRRWTMMVIDISALSVMLCLGEQYASLFWGVLLWVSLDYGFRYGAVYLQTAVPAGVIGFTMPLLFGSTFWRESIWLWSSIVLALVIIPLAVLHQAKRNEAATAAVRKSSRDKTRLLGHLTSTLQTPLGGILRSAEAIQHAPERTVTLANVIALSARHLLILTQDMMDSAAIEAGQLRRQDCAFDIREVCNEAVAALLAAAEAKSVTFKMDVDANVPDLVYADLAHVRQILVYCLEGVLVSATAAVHVRISARKIGAADNVIVDVWATDAPVQVERAYLAITMAPALIEFLGGETGLIEDGDKVGRWLSLPCQFLATQSPQSAPPPDAENVLAFTDIFIRHRNTVPKLRLLVIDDQASARFLLEGIVSKAGHSVTTAATGEDGLDEMELAAAAGNAFDVILLDLHLPDQPGANVIRLINYMQVGKRTPLIVITADRSDAALAACRDAGVAAFLSKPIKSGQLLDAIAFAASLRPGGQSTAPTQVSVSHAGVHEREEALAREFIRRCLLDAETALNRVRSAAVSMEWAEAAEHAYSVYAVAVNTTDAALIEAASALYQLPTPAFMVYWRERVEAVQAAIGWLRETNAMGTR